MIQSTDHLQQGSAHGNRDCVGPKTPKGSPKDHEGCRAGRDNPGESPQRLTTTQVAKLFVTWARGLTEAQKHLIGPTVAPVAVKSLAMAAIGGQVPESQQETLPDTTMDGNWYTLHDLRDAGGTIWRLTRGGALHVFKRWPNDDQWFYYVVKHIAQS